MAHDWILEVLEDMKSYADRHGMAALSAKVDETLAIARAEIAAAADDGGNATPPASSRSRRN